MGTEEVRVCFQLWVWVRVRVRVILSSRNAYTGTGRKCPKIAVRVRVRMRFNIVSMGTKSVPVYALRGMVWTPIFKK